MNFSSQRAPSNEKRRGLRPRRATTVIPLGLEPFFLRLASFCQNTQQNSIPVYIWWHRPGLQKKAD
jgi:hypothetical protein